MTEFKLNRILVAVADPLAGLNKAIRRARALAHQTGAVIDLSMQYRSSVSTASCMPSRSISRVWSRAAPPAPRAGLRTVRREELMVNTKCRPDTRFTRRSCARCKPRKPIS